MSQTIAQKILARKSNKSSVNPGEIVVVHPDRVMSHDNAALVIRYFNEIGKSKIWDPSKVVIILDHRTPAESVKTANAHQIIRQFVQEQNIQHFYEIGQGICHQIMLEDGFVLPGNLILGTDSHTTSYGCIGAFSTGIGATEMAAIWATSEIWLKVPETIFIELSGELTGIVSAKDIILYIIGQLKSDGANYKSVEFSGELISKLSISERFTMTNLSMEMGAKCAFMPVDDQTKAYYSQLGKSVAQDILPDSDAEYEKKINIDVNELQPQIACPHHVDHVMPVQQVAGKKINQALIGSCTNGRIEDFRIAASILKGKKIHPTIRMLIIPASKKVYQQMIHEKLMDIFLDANCVICNPGCGPCLGAHQGLLGDGEVCIATTNRNFKGRMGSPKAEVYLASPAIVACSALAGEITLW